jgi:hypothetical protein
VCNRISCICNGISIIFCLVGLCATEYLAYVMEYPSYFVLLDCVQQNILHTYWNIHHIVSCWFVCNRISCIRNGISIIFCLDGLCATEYLAYVIEYPLYFVLMVCVQQNILHTYWNIHHILSCWFVCNRISCIRNGISIIFCLVGLCATEYHAYVMEYASYFVLLVCVQQNILHAVYSDIGVGWLCLQFVIYGRVSQHLIVMVFIYRIFSNLICTQFLPPS